jgi:uncharacterized protein YacL
VPVRKWHPGKLIILWAWGGLVVALALAEFMSSPADSAPVPHLLELAGAVVILLVLSLLTWRWLGGRE